jgi:hypothetical protein
MQLGLQEKLEFRELLEINLFFSSIQNQLEKIGRVDECIYCSIGMSWSSAHTSSLDLAR